MFDGLMGGLPHEKIKFQHELKKSNHLKGGFFVPVFACLQENPL